MCVNDSIYNQASEDYKKADEEYKRCVEGLNYFNQWIGPIGDCMGCLEQMISQAKAIGDQCSEIIINGKPIDQGARHYPNGGAHAQANKLEKARSQLEQLHNQIQKSIEDLTTSKENAEKAKKQARKTMEVYPAPCYQCIECCPPVAKTTTSSTSTAGSAPSSTSTTGSGPSSTSSGGGSSRTSGVTHNRAVAVPLD